MVEENGKLILKRERAGYNPAYWFKGDEVINNPADIVGRSTGTPSPAPAPSPTPAPKPIAPSTPSTALSETELEGRLLNIDCRGKTDVICNAQIEQAKVLNSRNKQWLQLGDNQYRYESKDGKLILQRQCGALQGCFLNDESVTNPGADEKLKNDLIKAKKISLNGAGTPIAEAALFKDLFENPVELIGILLVIFIFLLIAAMKKRSNQRKGHFEIFRIINEKEEVINNLREVWSDKQNFHNKYKIFEALQKEFEKIGENDIAWIYEEEPKLEEFGENIGELQKIESQVVKCLKKLYKTEVECYNQWKKNWVGKRRMQIEGEKNQLFELMIGNAPAESRIKNIRDVEYIVDYLGIIRLIILFYNVENHAIVMEHAEEKILEEKSMEELRKQFLKDKGAKIKKEASQLEKYAYYEDIIMSKLIEKIDSQIRMMQELIAIAKYKKSKSGKKIFSYKKVTGKIFPDKSKKNALEKIFRELDEISEGKGESSTRAPPKPPPQRPRTSTNSGQAPPYSQKKRASGLIEQINEMLAESRIDEVQIPVSPANLVEYITTLNLPAGSRIVEANATIEVNGLLNLIGTISTKGGNVKFRVTLSNSIPPAVGLQVVSQNMQLPLVLKLYRRRIEQQITNLNQILIERINDLIDSNWKLSNFQINGNNLIFNFKRR